MKYGKNVFQELTYRQQKLVKNNEAISLLRFANCSAQTKFNKQDCYVYTQLKIADSVKQELVDKFNSVGLCHFASYDLELFNINNHFYKSDNRPVCQRFKIAYFFPSESVEIFEFVVINADYKAAIEQAGYKLGFETDFNEIAKLTKNTETNKKQKSHESSCLIM